MYYYSSSASASSRKSSSLTWSPRSSAVASSSSNSFFGDREREVEDVVTINVDMDASAGAETLLDLLPTVIRDCAPA
jgi:flagellar basal body L-ring protein FlgH